MKTAFIGHRRVFAKDISERLDKAIREEIENGCMTFTVGTHGEFDRIALAACKRLRHTYTNMKIEVVITSLNAIKKADESNVALYDDVEIVMYDIEDVYFKRKITLSNRQMLDSCDTLICYVDTSVDRSGAKAALLYAKKRGLKIVNLYRKEDKLFYGMTQEEKAIYLKEVFEKLEK